MKRLLLALIVVVSSTGLASGGLLFRSKKEIDFGGVARHLAKKADGRASPEAIVAVLKDDMAQYRDGPKRRAAEIFVELAEAPTCSDQLLRTLRRATKAGLMDAVLSSDPKTSRALEFIEPHMDRLLNSCEAYIDQELDERLEAVVAADDKMRQFIETIRPSYIDFSKNSMPEVFDLEFKTANYEFVVDDNFKLPTKCIFGFTQSITEEQLNHYLSVLARQAGLSPEHFNRVAGDKVSHERHPEEAFEALFVEPCRRFESTFEPLFEGAKAMGAVMGKNAYVDRRNLQFRRLAYSHKVCEAVLMLDDDDDDDNNKRLGFNKQDMLASLVASPRSYGYCYEPGFQMSWDSDSDSDSDSD